MVKQLVRRTQAAKSQTSHALRIAVKRELIRHRAVLMKLGIPSTEPLDEEVEEHIKMVKDK